MTFPLGLLRAPLKLGLGLAESALQFGLGVARGAHDAVARGGEQAEAPPTADASAWSVPSPEGTADAPPRSASAASAPAPAAAPAPPASPAPSGEHLHEEPVLVAVVAEEGAQDGAGAELHVDEPWEGYDSLRVPEIRSVLEAAGRETLAAVELYEQLHKGRSSVVEAAARRLALLS